MTPKDKAWKIYYKYWITVDKLSAKKCALIAVDELIKEASFEVPNIRQRYWQEVNNL